MTVVLVVVIFLAGCCASFYVGARFGRSLGEQLGYLEARKRFDPNVTGGFSEHYAIRRHREQRMLAEERAAERMRWN